MVRRKEFKGLEAKVFNQGRMIDRLMTSINRLESRNLDLSTQISKMSDELWRVKNPPKYKMLDKIVFSAREEEHGYLSLDNTREKIVEKNGTIIDLYSFNNKWEYKVVLDNEEFLEVLESNIKGYEDKSKTKHKTKKG